MIHGHTLMLDYLKKEKKLENKLLVEIGTTREYGIHGLNSTQEFSDFCDENNMFFISVDMDSENSINATKYLKKNQYALTMKGEDFLAGFMQKIDFIYLDAFDFYHQNHSQKRLNKYKDILNCKLSDINCWIMHLECCKHLVNKLSSDGFICFDDILNDNEYDGKGKLAIPYLFENGFKKIEFVPNAIILKR